MSAHERPAEHPAQLDRRAPQPAEPYRPCRPAPSRSPAGLRELLDLRLRRPHARRLVWVLISGLVLALKGALWWHSSSVGHFFNSTHLWSVELFFVFMVIHLWGKFFMAAWRGRRALTWITGARGLPRLGRHRVHRLPVAVELRLAVDLDPGQGRPELRRDRRGVQRARHRSDAAVARHAAAAGGRRAHRAAHHPGAPPRGRPAVRRGSAGLGGARQRPSCRVSVHAPWTTDSSRRRGIDREPVMSPRHGATRRRTRTCSRPARTTWSRNSSSRWSSSGCSPARSQRRCPHPTARRSPWRTGRRPPPTTWSRRQRPSSPAPAPAPATGRRTTTPTSGRSCSASPRRSGAGSRSRSTAPTTSSSIPLRTVQNDPKLTAALKTWDQASADQQTKWAGGYSDAIAAAPDGAVAKVKPGDYGPVPQLGTSFLTLAGTGGLEGLLTTSGHLLQRQRDQAAAAAGRRRLPGGPGPRRTSRRRPVGNDERDRQLPGPALAVAVHVLVPGQAVLDLGQRRRAGVGADGGAQPRASSSCRSSRACARCPSISGCTG